jgi:serine/threonine protein kinase
LGIKRINGRYEIKAMIGEGGMGVVFRAYDPPPMDRDVAVKTLPELHDRLALELFYKECSVLKSISHPNIVEIFDMGEFEEAGEKRPFFVMPLLSGQTLDQLIRNDSHRLTVERVVEIISQTCRGLQAAHDRGLVHRDLKPSNIFVMGDDSVKIIDFGVAHVVDSLSRSGFKKGTLLYMAPEQVQYKPVTVQSDLFSLGVVCYEALTRRRPFRGAREEEVVHEILRHIPQPCSDINPAVSQTISRVVHKAMAKQPWSRYDSARDFAETLQRAMRNEPIELFDPARLAPRIQRATKALENDPQFASELLSELEAEGNIDQQISLLRAQIDQVSRLRTIAQLLEGARARYEAEEDPLALLKIQEVLQLDPTNAAALGLKSKIEDRRSDQQIDGWFKLARQHIDNHSYNHAQDALQKVLQLRPREPRASRLLAELQTEEEEYLRLRQQKAQIYQSAVNAWKNGEVSEALSRMREVMELDGRAPDTSSPDTSSTYQTFYNKVRSEHDEINHGYADARRQLADREFTKALKICNDVLGRYPGQALFQALKFDIEEQQRQQLSAFIADVDRRLEAEPDLDAKVNLLREAVAAYPGEPHFERSLKQVDAKRDLVNSIVAKARLREENGQINEALSELEVVRTIYSRYPGLQFEIERLQKRRAQQARDETKAGLVRQIDRQLEAGNYARSLELLEHGQTDFPDDAELMELRKQAEQGFDRANRAEQQLAEGQALCAQGEFERGLDLLRDARRLDERNPVIRATLRDVLVERARVVLENDWQASEALTAQALDLDPNHPRARSLRAQALDRKREEFVSLCVSQARRLQAAGDLEAALRESERGLSVYPLEPRLTLLVEKLNKELGPPRTRAVADHLSGESAIETVAPEEGILNVTWGPEGAIAVVSPANHLPGRSADPVPDQSGAQTAPRSVPLPAGRPAVMKGTSASRKRRETWVILGVIVCVLVAALVGVLRWIGRGPSAFPAAPVASDRAEPLNPLPSRPITPTDPWLAPSLTPSIDSLRTVELERQFLRTLDLGRRSFQSGLWSQALEHAESAERLRPGDSRTAKFFDDMKAVAENAAQAARAAANDDRALEFAADAYGNGERTLREGARAAAEGQLPLAIRLFRNAEGLFGQAADAAKLEIGKLRLAPPPQSISPPPSLPTSMDDLINEQTTLIVTTLKKVEEAFARRDQVELKNLWPSNDFTKKLSEGRIRTAELRIERAGSAEINLEQGTATLPCKLTFTYTKGRMVGIFGGGEETQGPTLYTLSLKKQGDRWFIVSPSNTTR